MGFSSPKPPSVKLPPPAAHPAILGSAMTSLAAQEQKQSGAVAEGMGFNDTIKTSPKGLEAPATAKATLLG